MFSMFFILFNTVSYIEINLKLKIDPKMCTFKTWKKFGKPGKSLEKTSGNPENIIMQFYFNKSLKLNVILIRFLSI